jgi:transposase
MRHNDCLENAEETRVPSKKKSLYAAEQDRPDVREKREIWQEKTAGTDLSRFVFLDESGAKTDMTRLYARSFDGERIVDSTPQSHWHTTTMISALRLDGSSESMAIEGATDGEVFQAYVDKVLSLSLKPGEIVVMDNLSPHRMHGVRKSIEAKGAELWFLPPYSPDMNPIEKMWSKIKAFLRKVKARTEEALFIAIRDALRTVTASDALGWFASCGYVQS